MDMPSFLLAGDKARLFSSLKISNKEQIATATVLSVMRLIPELLPELIRDTGVRINDKTKFETYTEVTLSKTPDERRDRPDGFIYIKNRNEWTALVESKVGNNLLEIEQVSRYLEDARVNGINAVITISNEFTPRVEQSPLNIPKRLISKVNLYHISWRLILSTCMRIKNEKTVTDKEKLSVLDEFIRFLKDDSVGNKNFTMMPKSWPEICSEAAIGVKFKSTDARVLEVSNALVEEFSEIALNLTDHLGVDCSAKLPKKLQVDKSLWQKQIARCIIENKTINCSYFIPDAAEDLSLDLDLSRSSFSVGMEVRAPSDRTTNSGKANWFLRQLKGNVLENGFVKIRWSSRAADTFLSIEETNQEWFKANNSAVSISSFTPMLQIHSSKIISSRKIFIQELESSVITFYDTYAQYLKQFSPKAPKPVENSEAIE